MKLKLIIIFRRIHLKVQCIIKIDENHWYIVHLGIDISYEVLKEEAEKSFGVSDMSLQDLQDETRKPSIIKKIKKTTRKIE